VFKQSSSRRDRRGLASRQSLRRVGALLLTLLVAGCGGGGGGTGSTGGADSPGTVTSPSNGWLSFFPDKPEVSIYEGQQQEIRIVASSSKVIEGLFNVGVIDARGVVEAAMDVRQVSESSYAATLRTAKTLAVGTYEGNFEVRLCRDTPTVCAQPIDGSPWKVPYKITIRSGANLSVLSAMPGAAGWSGYQGGSDHTGVVKATISTEAITRRWVKDIRSSGLVADGGKVFLTPLRDQFGPLIAVAEQDGAELWRTPADRVWYSTPAADDGMVWVLGNDGDSTAYLLGYDGPSGAKRRQSEVPSSFRPDLLAPVLDAGHVYVGSDEGVTYRYSKATGARTWRSGPLVAPLPIQSGEYWTPALGHGRLVSFDGNQLWIADAVTGQHLGRIDGPHPNAVSSNKIHTVGTAPVLSTDDRAYVTAYVMAAVPTGRVDSGAVTAFDLRNQQLLWSVRTDVRSNPVLADGVIYVALANFSLQALDASTGKELWNWKAPTDGVPGADMPLLVIGNHAFVGLGGTTYAVDLRTRTAVWQYQQTGPMAVSANGVLYIGGGALAAFNLR
jgi:outer membrane protein assembly factor BamB